MGIVAAAAATVLGLAGVPVARADVEEIDCGALEHIKVGDTAAFMKCEAGAQRGRDAEGSGRPTGSTIEVGTGFDLTAGAIFVLVWAEAAHHTSFGAISLREFADSMFTDIRDWNLAGRNGSFETAALDGRLRDKPDYKSCAVFLHQFKPTGIVAGYGGYAGGFLCSLKDDLNMEKARVFLENVTY